MKKIFALLLLSVVIFSANVTHAAKEKPFAEITAEEFFSNMGYEVDCSHWEYTRNRRRLFAAMLPEEPLVVAKDLANVEVIAEPTKGFILEVSLFLQAGDEDATASMVARVINALDAELFGANQAAIEQKISDLMNSLNSPDEVLVTVNAPDRNFILSKEAQRGKILLVQIKPVAPNE